MIAHEQRTLPVAALILAVAAVAALALALPGRTVTTAYLNDLVIFLDGAHRIVWGQVPHRDFHSALGPLTLYIPAAGYWLTGSFGAAMPAGTALLTLLLAPALAHILASRLHPLLALLYGSFLILILVVPINLGEAVTSLSFAMFYNRIGWVALGALLVMYLLPRRVRPYQERLDVACATLLTLVMLYTKATYGLVALAFLVFLLSDPRQRRVAASVLALTGLAVLLVEAVWQGSAQYIADLVLTGKVSGTRGPESLVLGFLRHLSDYVLFAVLAALVLWRTCSLRDLLFFGFCAVPGLLIQAQNSQPWGIITLHAGAVVAAEFLLRSETREKARTLASGSIFLVAALLLPTMIHYALGLGIHTSLAVAQAGRPFGLPAFEQVRFTLPWAPGEYGFMGRYLDTIEDGAKALSGLPGRPERVSVLDFANPFSAGLNLPPPRGDNAWLHWGRNVSAEHFIPPEEMFRDVRFLMLPKWGINPVPLRDLYGAYVDANFDHAAETDFWIVAARRGTGADEMAKGGSSVDACSATEPARAWRVGAGYGCPQ